MSPAHPESAALLDKTRQLARTVGELVRGKPEVIRLAEIALFSGGHLLLEDIPGVGKTMLALALARAVAVEFKRVQFTNDTLPGDILGFSSYNQKTGEFEFHRGPIFAGVMLADEINRTSPKTQSALLEAMTERKVTVDNGSYPLPEPFMVIATQNPTDHAGTFPLPDSQLDRFLIRTRMGYPDVAHEREILKEDIDLTHAERIRPVMTGADALAVQQATSRVFVEDSLVDYILTITAQTRKHPRIAQGVSPRGALMLKRAAQARAWLEGREFVVPDDIRALAVPTLAHRLMVAGHARGGLGERTLAEGVMEEILGSVKTPV